MREIPVNLSLHCLSAGLGEQDHLCISPGARVGPAARPASPRRRRRLTGSRAPRWRLATPGARRRPARAQADVSPALGARRPRRSHPGVASLHGAHGSAHGTSCVCCAAPTRERTESPVGMLSGRTLTVGKLHDVVVGESALGGDQDRAVRETRLSEPWEQPYRRAPTRRTAEAAYTYCTLT